MKNHSISSNVLKSMILVVSFYHIVYGMFDSISSPDIYGVGETVNDPKQNNLEKFDQYSSDPNGKENGSPTEITRRQQQNIGEIQARVETLIKNGANLSDEEYLHEEARNTLLHRACKYGSEHTVNQIVRYLEYNGKLAQLELRNTDRQTGIDIARAKQNEAADTTSKQQYANIIFRLGLASISQSGNSQVYIGGSNGSATSTHWAGASSSDNTEEDTNDEPVDSTVATTLSIDTTSSSSVEQSSEQIDLGTQLPAASIVQEEQPQFNLAPSNNSNSIGIGHDIHDQVDHVDSDSSALLPLEEQYQSNGASQGEESSSNINIIERNSVEQDPEQIDLGIQLLAASIVQEEQPQFNLAPSNNSNSIGIGHNISWQVDHSMRLSADQNTSDGIVQLAVASEVLGVFNQDSGSTSGVPSPVSLVLHFTPASSSLLPVRTEANTSSPAQSNTGHRGNNNLAISSLQSTKSPEWGKWMGLSAAVLISSGLLVYLIDRFKTKTPVGQSAAVV
jgi:hypothetical protein